MEILYILLVILVFTRACGELASRVGQPPLAGDLVGGVVLGVIVHRFDAAFPVLSELSHNEVFLGVTDLGVFFLMLLAGLEMHPRGLADASRGAVGVAVGGRALGKKMFRQVSQTISGVTSGFLAPVFCASIGYRLDVSAFQVMPLFVITLVVLAMLSKILGAGLMARAVGIQAHDATMIGIAMSGRGPSSSSSQTSAFRAGLFSRPDPTPPFVSNLFSAVVIMAIATTLFMPIGLRLIAKR